MRKENDVNFPPAKEKAVCIFLKTFVYLFLEKGEGREKERERNTDVRENH